MTSSSKKSLYTILGGALICIAVLTSCENFLRGGEIKKEIEDAIAYNNAKEISVLIQPEEGTGSTVPSGNHKAKKGYNFDVSFSENPAYSFIKWKAVTADKAQTPVTDGVVFEEVNSPITRVKISNDTVAIRIIPECAERIAVSGEPSPRYDPLGVSRDRSISVTFTKPLAESNFIFTEEEIPAGAQRKEDENGVWAYTYEGQTYLKNISITNIDDYSIAEHFTKPVVSDKLLTVAVDKTNPIKFNSGEIFKTVKVTLSKDITDTSNVKMSSAKSWNYQITEKTDEQATVNLTSVAAEGSVYLAGTKDYSLGQKITLSFTEDADYQFIKWEYDPQIIYINEPTNLNTTATVLDKTTEENPTQIKAICAPRLRVTSFAPVNDSANPTVSKNSSIKIVFNHDIPSEDNDKNQLNNISITMNGTPVKSSFKTPSVSLNTINILAEKSNMLDVSGGQTKTVSVTIPSDFYYTLQDGTKVYYGGNGISFDYKIDETTLDKAEVNYLAPADSGDFVVNTQKVKVTDTYYYSINQEIDISFELKNGWQFNGWSVICENEEVPESKIKIFNRDNLSTKIKIFDALPGVYVKANASEILSCKLNPLPESVNPELVNKKDSAIVIKFNKPLAAACADSDFLDKIQISSEGKSLKGCYTDRVLSGDTVTINNTTSLDVSKDETKIITVTVPSDFYYEDNGTIIKLTETSFNFTVNYETNAKAKVTYSIINGETSNAFNPVNAAGTLSAVNYVEYNIGEEVPVSIDVNSAYQFYTWELKTRNNENQLVDVSTNQISFENGQKETKLKMKTAGIYYVNAVCYKRPSISAGSYTPYNSNNADAIPKNTPIAITFDHKIERGTEDNIIISYSALPGFNNDKKYYFDIAISDDDKTVSFTPIKMLPLSHTNETVTVTVPVQGEENVYYYARDGKTKITPADKDFTWSYKINDSTITKTIVSYETTDAAVSGRQISVDGTFISSGVTQPLNIDQTRKLVFPKYDGYDFGGWKIQTASNSYTVTTSGTASPDGYVKEGTISVKFGTKTYLEFVIDKDNPSHATLTSYDSIGEGNDGYGITVLGKDIVLPTVESVQVYNTTTSNIYATTSNICDSKVYINFNKSIDTTSVTLSKSGSISITKAGSLTQHYETYFSKSWANSNKQLILTPYNTIKDLVPDDNDIFEFVIKLNANGNQIKDSDGYMLGTSAAIYNSFEIPYTIRGEREKTLPVWYNSQSLYDKEGSESILLSSTAFGSWGDLIYQQNHIKNSVYFNMHGNDSDSGISILRLTETHYKDAGGGEGNLESISTEYSPNDFKPNYTRAHYTHTLKTKADGVVKLDFEWVDNAGNSSTKKTYYVIKDTYINMSLVKFTEFERTSDYNSTIPRRNATSSGDTITMTLKNTAVDRYYQSTSKTYSTDYNVTIQWGYTENTFNNTASKNSNVYTFTRDPARTVYLKISCSDNVGNTKDFMRIIPGSPDLPSVALGEWSPGEGGSRRLVCRPSNFNSVKSTALSQTADAYGYLFIKKTNSSGSSTESVSRFTDITCGKLLTMGYKYEIYIAYGIEYTDGTIWYSTPSTKYLNINMLNDTKDSPNHTETVVDPNSSQVSTYSSAPTCSITTTTDNMANSGCVRCTLTLPSSYNTTAYDWIYRFVNTSTLQYEVFTTNTFNLPTPATYNLYFMSKNKSNGSIGNYTTKVQVSLNSATAKNDIVLTADTTPPDFSGDNYTVDPNGILYYSEPTDSGSGIYTNFAGRGVITCYFIPNSATNINQFSSYTMEELSAYTPKTVLYTIGSKNIFIPYEGLEEGFYTVCVVVKDNADNYKIYCFPAYNKTLKKSISTEMKYENSAWKVYVNYDQLPSSWGVNFYDYATDGRTGWNSSYSVNAYEGVTSQGNSRIFNLGYYANDYIHNSWIKVVARSYYNNTVAKAGYYNIDYFYPDYYMKAGTNSAITCKNKNILNGGYGVQVFCDAPTFAHAVYYPRKLTETNNTSDIGIWETKGCEVNPVFSSTNFTYGEDKLSSIPDGMYYTIVVHFADGSKVMSEVKQKQ